MSGLTPNQHLLMLHALGASTNPKNIGWRNRFHASVLDKDCAELVHLGYMVRGQVENETTSYHVVKAGIIALGLNPSELDPDWAEEVPK